jgi:nitrate reductase (NAD(P)H)
MMPDYHIGTLSKTAMEALKDASQEEQGEGSGEVFLEPRSWKKAGLCKKQRVSWDTRIFTFQLQHEQQTVGLPTGQHLMLKIEDPSAANKSIIRAYTPISQTDRKATMELLVKVYAATNTAKGGQMTTALDELPIGATVEFKGPIGKFRYLGRGKIALNEKERQVNSFRMICGGTGITPIFQVLRAVMQDPEDTLDCVVIDGNRMEDDILCRAELDTFANMRGPQCTIVHSLTKATEAWTGRRGRISKELLAEYVSPSEGSMVLICGPESMEKSVKEILLALGWNEADLVFF